MSKLIIHVTDEIKGEAKVFYNGKLIECEANPILEAIDIFNDLGFINEEEDVIMVVENDIYKDLSDTYEVIDSLLDKATDLLEDEDDYYDDIDPDYAYEEFETEGEEEAE